MKGRSDFDKFAQRYGRRRANFFERPHLTRRAFFQIAGGAAAGFATVTALLAGTKKVATHEMPASLLEAGGASETMRKHNRRLLAAGAGIVQTYTINDRIPRAPR